jgi:hypothetical protein
MSASYGYSEDQEPAKKKKKKKKKEYRSTSCYRNVGRRPKQGRAGDAGADDASPTAASD